jgi:hypothetical protein
LNVRRLGNHVPTDQPACRQRITSRCLRAGWDWCFGFAPSCPLFATLGLFFCRTFIVHIFLVPLLTTLIEIPPLAATSSCSLPTSTLPVQVKPHHNSFHILLPILFLILCPCSLVVIDFWNISLGNVFSSFLSVHCVFFAPSLSSNVVQVSNFCLPHPRPTSAVATSTVSLFTAICVSVPRAIFSDRWFSPVHLLATFAAE